MSVLQDYYNENDDDIFQILSSLDQLCQTFTTNQAYSITSVKLKLYKTGNPGTLTVEIQGTDGAGKPDGSAISSGTIDADSFTTNSAGEWYEISLTSYALSSSTKYAIVLKCPTADASNGVIWRSDNSSASYAGGQGGNSSDGGSSWSMFSDDRMFETYSSSVTEQSIRDSGSGVDSILVNKHIILSENGSGEDLVLTDRQLNIADSGAGAESVAIAKTIGVAISEAGVGVDRVSVSKQPAFVEKHVLMKVYDSEGNYIQSWSDATFAGFSKRINGGLSECQIKLGREFDDYGEYYDVALNNEVQILITDRDTRDDDSDDYVKIYSGYISKYSPWIEGGREGVIISCLGYYTKLAQDIYKNGTTTTIQETAEDVGTIFRNIMDRYIAETTNPKLHYDYGSIRPTSTTATYIFEMMTYREAIEIVKGLAPVDWFWYVDQNNIVNFKSKPTTPDHTFIFGRHFFSVRVEKSMEKIKNALLFWNKEKDDNKIYKLYTDEVSVGDYGRRVIKHIDQNRVGATIDADKIGDSFVGEHKEPDIKVVVEIIDNAESPLRGYDIESIEPGQTCSFVGFSDALDETFKENMMITEVEYTLEKVRLTIEPTRASIVDRLEHVAKQVNDVNTKDAPTSYST